MLGVEAPPPGLRLVGQGRGFAVRNEHVVVIVVVDDIDDQVSDAWKAATQTTFDREGYPPFGFVDAVAGRSVGSLQGKLRSAAFMRRSADNMRRIALVSDVRGGIVIKSVMRVASAGNVHLVSRDAALSVLEQMKLGTDPFAAQ